MAASKAGRPAGSRNKRKDKTLEDFGVNIVGADIEKRLKILMRIFKEETIAELKEYNDRRMESMMENIRKKIQEDRAGREEEINKWKKKKKWNVRKNKRIRNGAGTDRKRKKKEEFGDKRSEHRKNKQGNRIEDLIEEKLGVGIQVAYEIKSGESKKGIVVTVKNWEMKRNIMMKKNNLEKGIYI